MRPYVSKGSKICIQYYIAPFVKTFRKRISIGRHSVSNASGISLHPVFPFPVCPTCPQRHFPLCVSKFTRFFLYPLPPPLPFLFCGVSLPSFLTSSKPRPFFPSVRPITVPLSPSFAFFTHALSYPFQKARDTAFPPTSVIFPAQFFSPPCLPSLHTKFLRPIPRA